MRDAFDIDIRRYGDEWANAIWLVPSRGRAGLVRRPT
jgi:hypothetical protein